MGDTGIWRLKSEILFIQPIHSQVSVIQLLIACLFLYLDLGALTWEQEWYSELGYSQSLGTTSQLSEFGAGEQFLLCTEKGF